MRRVVLFAVFALGCGQANAATETSSEPVQTQTAALTEGGPNVANGAIVWKDSTGAVVPFLTVPLGAGVDGSGGLFIDSTTGLVWLFGHQCSPFDSATAICAPTLGSGNWTTLYFDGPGCTGNQFVPYTTAGFPFVLAEPGADGGGTTTLRAVKDVAKVATRTMQSSFFNHCTDAVTLQPTVPIAAVPIVAAPSALPFTLPIHPVMLK